MASVPSSTAQRKVFRAHFYDESGQLSKVAGNLYFFSDAGEVSEVEVSDVNFLVVLGEAMLVDAQYVDDLMNGGAAAIACSRDEGRQ